MTRPLTVVQLLPALDAGGVEQGTLDLGRYLVQHGHRSVVIAAGGRMAERLVQDGSEHLDWPIGAKRLSTLRYIPKLRNLLRSQRPDILHLRSRLPAWIGYLAWCGLDPATRPHLITTVHGPYTPNRYSAIMVRGERVIAVSSMISDYILEHYAGRVNPQHIRIIHRGVDPARHAYNYQPSTSWQQDWWDQYPQTRNTWLLTLPARLTRWKGQEDFIQIIQALRQQGLPVHGLLVGEAHHRKQAYAEELRQHIMHAGLQNHITLTGHRTDLREILAISHCVFSLSYQPEAFGRTTLEALSLGRPVIGYNHGGVGEQLACLFPQGCIPVRDRAAAVELIQSWGSTPPRPRDEHPFTLEAMCEQTLAVYAEVSLKPFAGNDPDGGG